MLELIDELGSMQATAKTLGMSYRGVWARLKATEERLGIKLVETSVGRGKNRGSKLTPEAKKLLANYKLLLDQGVEHSDELFDSIFLGVSRTEKSVTPAVVVCGPKGSGRTDFITSLIRLWGDRGRSIGVIDVQEQSQERGNAETPFGGAEAVIRTDGRTLTVELPAGPELTSEIIAANYALGCDLVLVKSDRSMHLPTVEVYRKDLTGERLLTRKKRNLLAVVGDPPKEKTNRPYFGEDDTIAVVDLIEEKILESSEDKKQVQLKVNGKLVPMLPFVQDIFKQGVTGMVASLKSCADPSQIELVINNKPVRDEAHLKR